MAAVVKRGRYLGKMTSKGQTTVPKEVRDFLGLGEGTQVEWILDDDGKATVKPRTLRAVDLAGFLGKPPKGAGATIKDMDDAIAEAVIERFERAVRR
jgi:AbrB family looped-hinge helix DNA binding protein